MKSLQVSVERRCVRGAGVVSGEEVAPEVALVVAPRLVRSLRGDLLLRGRGTTPFSPLPIAAAMAKGRVAERSQQTGALQPTPMGDGNAGTRGPAAPGGRDHVKGEWTRILELRGWSRGLCVGRGSGGERTPAVLRVLRGKRGSADVWGREQENGILGPLLSSRPDA